MKTQKTSNPNLPSPVKFSIYIIAVALLGLLNWNALKASDPESDETKTLKVRLEAALVPVVETEIVLEDWMLTFSNEVAFEDEIELEDWMLNVDENLITDAAELEIALEDWMLIVPDPAPAIEDWMVNTETWASAEYLAKK